MQFVFCQQLSESPEEKKAGREYRLPTEAELECTCRAGSNTPFSGTLIGADTIAGSPFLHTVGFPVAPLMGQT